MECGQYFLESAVFINSRHSQSYTMKPGRVSFILSVGIVRPKRDGTRAETRLRLSPQRTSPFKRRGRQFSRLLAADVCASALVMLDTPRSEVV
jgi:hypothetical protein